MTFKERLVNMLMNKIQTVSTQQREVEDIYRKFSLDHTVGKDYIAIDAYRMALADILTEIRRIDDKPTSSRDIRKKKRGNII